MTWCLFCAQYSLNEPKPRATTILQITLWVTTDISFIFISTLSKPEASPVTRIIYYTPHKLFKNDRCYWNHNSRSGQTSVLVNSHPTRTHTEKYRYPYNSGVSANEISSSQTILFDNQINEIASWAHENAGSGNDPHLAGNPEVEYW